jgi:hypothetical protein
MSVRSTQRPRASRCVRSRHSGGCGSVRCRPPPWPAGVHDALPELAAGRAEAAQRSAEEARALVARADLFVARARAVLAQAADTLGIHGEAAEEFWREASDLLVALIDGPTDVSKADMRDVFMPVQRRRSR